MLGACGGRLVRAHVAFVGQVCERFTSRDGGWPNAQSSSQLLSCALLSARVLLFSAVLAQVSFLCEV